MLQDDVAVNTLHTSGRLFSTGKMQVPRKSPDTSASIYRDWLRRLPELTGKSHTAIATEIGIAVSTLTRPLRDDDPGTSGPRQSTIDRIVNRYHIAPPSFAPSAPIARSLRGMAEDARQYEPDENFDGEAVRSLMRAGPNIDPWIIKTRALELVGYLPGDIVMVDLSKAPVPGDVVCAQVNIDFQRGTADTIMRVYERAGAAHILVAASLDPSLRIPLAVDDRVAIKGVVVSMIRPMRNAA